MPSPPNPNPSSTYQNGHLSPLAHNVTNADELASQSESDLSEVRDAPVEPPNHTAIDTQDADGDHEVDMEESDPSEDEDAEGIVDADYAEDTLPVADFEVVDAEGSSDNSPRPGKRKASEEDDNFMVNDPELYGLRRSGRSRNNRRVVESSDDEDSGSDAIGGRPSKKRKTAAPSKSSHRATPTIQSTADSGSESDTYVGARRDILTKKQRQHQLQVAAGLAPPSQGEVRFSTRRAAKVTNYNLDESDDFEEDASEMTPNNWVYVDDTSPAIDIVLQHRRKEDADPQQELGKHDYEFQIKWQGKAHYHSTWEVWQSLSGYRGFRRLENYFRKVVQEEQRIQEDPTVAPEEKEKWILDREKEADAQNDYVHVERVIGRRDGEEETEYLVKWKSLTYDYSTWEPASLVSSIAQSEIDNYLNRSSKLPTSNKTESNPKTRGKYVAFKNQPEYITYGQLREFQILGVNFLAHNWCEDHNVILADEMGLGKTVQTVSFINWLRHDRGQQGPFLVVVPLSTLPAWADTFTNWTPDTNYVVYTGKEPARNIIKEHELLVNGDVKKTKFNVLLTTYEYILADSTFLSQLNWQFMAVDEAHRLKNKDSQLYQKLLDFGAPCRLLITGTPMQNNIGELSALMNFLEPGKGLVDDEIDLQNTETAGEKLRELGEAIKPYMLRRTKQKVENDLPPKTEKIIRVELSDVQLEYYKNILTRNYAALNEGAKGQKQSLLNIMIELKKASNHPFMFPNAEERILGGSDRREDVLRALITSSGKLMLIDRLLTKLKRDGHRVLIFSQMVKMLDILGDYLHLRNYQFQRLDGTIASGPRRMAIDHFNAPESTDFCFLLSTRAGGLGINLMTADTVILFDSDWNPQADLQAMARAHRIGQQKPVTVYRLVSKDTVEEEILERARNKLMLEFITIQRGVTDKEAKDLENKMAQFSAEPTSSDDINQILKRRGQKMFEQSGNQRKLEELDIDAVLENAEEHKTEQPEGLTADGGEAFLKSFEYTDVKIDIEWDDIIPKDELEKIKEEEKKKEEEKNLAAIIEQNAPRKRKAPADGEREQRAAKKQARERAKEAAAEISGGEDDNDSDDHSGAQVDPKRPLNEKETRNLIRAYERYGSIEEKQEEMIIDAKLVGRDIDILKACLNDVIGISERMLKEEKDRVEQLERDGKTLTKKDRKAVLFDYHGVKRINAETIVERPNEMRMLRDLVKNTSDWSTFRVSSASKSAEYSCPWGAREDGMLCVGIARHGYGAWVDIREDPDLTMQDKFFLEEHRVDKKEERTKTGDKNAKSPGAVHLVRRANYLLNVLKVETSNGDNAAARKALENHHRNKKKLGLHGRRPDGNSSVSASPGPHAVRKVHREQDRPRHRGSSISNQRQSVDRRLPSADRMNTPDLHRKISHEADVKPKPRALEERPHTHHRSPSSNMNGHASPSHGDPMERMFRPIENNLKRVRTANKKDTPEPDARLKIIKHELITIGKFVRQAMRKDNSKTLESSMWLYVANNWWPRKDVTSEQLKAMYEKVEAKEASKNAEAKTNGQSH